MSITKANQNVFKSTQKSTIEELEDQISEERRLLEIDQDLLKILSERAIKIKNDIETKKETPELIIEKPQTSSMYLESKVIISQQFPKRESPNIARPSELLYTDRRRKERYLGLESRSDYAIGNITDSEFKQPLQALILPARPSPVPSDGDKYCKISERIKRLQMCMDHDLKFK